MENILLHSFSPPAMLHPKYDIKRGVQMSIAGLMVGFHIRDTFSGNLFQVVRPDFAIFLRPAFKI